jgi:hypothetical protein
MAFQRLALAFFSPMKRHNLMATMLAADSFGVINWPLPHFYEPQKPKRKCLLPDCENLTAHNGGYCCAEHCKNHKKLKQWTRATQTNTKPTGARTSGSARMLMGRRSTSRPTRPGSATRCIVYSGPHYGRTHKFLRRQNSMIWVSYQGDTFAVPHCDVEMLPNDNLSHGAKNL